VSKSDIKPFQQMKDSRNEIPDYLDKEDDQQNVYESKLANGIIYRAIKVDMKYKTLLIEEY
jgi:hypothetical protein